MNTLAWCSRRRSGVVHQGMALLHELWEDVGGEYGHETFCLSGPLGDGARALLSKKAKLVWTVEAGSHFEAMSRYYVHKG